MILLTDDDYTTGSIADLPINENVLTVIKGEISVTELIALPFPPISRLATYVIAWYIKNKWDWTILMSVSALWTIWKD